MTQALCKYMVIQVDKIQCTYPYTISSHWSDRRSLTHVPHSSFRSDARIEVKSAERVAEMVATRVKRTRK